MASQPAFARFVPPVPPPPIGELSTLRFVAAMRVNAIGGWPEAAYRERVLSRRVLGRTRITVSDPGAVRRVLVDRTETYVRTAITIRLLRPMLGDGLLISESGSWRHQRRTLAPAFAPRAVEALIPPIAAATNEVLPALAAAASEGPIDLFAALQRLTLEIAGRTMFSLGMAHHGERLRGFVERYSTRHAAPRLLDALLPRWLPSPHDLGRARFRRAWVRFLDEVVAERAAGRSIENGDRNGGGPDKGDLLDRLRDARDPDTGQGFTPEDLRDQVATLMLAGHETTAVTLLWTCTLLALMPDVQDAVAREVRAAGIGAEPLRGLPLTRAVVEETMRLYPPAFAISRQAVAEDMLADAPVAPGDIVLIAPWLLHRHRGLWRDPDAFDPGRFLPGAPPPPRYAYLPFGAGPRICIGAGFALSEAVVILARLVAAFRFARADDRPVLPMGVITTQPDHAPAFLLKARGA